MTPEGAAAAATARTTRARFRSLWCDPRQRELPQQRPQEQRVPAFARFGVIHTKGSCRSSDRDDFERSQPASQLARFGGMTSASMGMGVRFGVGGAKTRGRKGGQSTCVGSRTAQITFCLGSRRFRNRDESGDRNSYFRRRFCLDRPITELDWKVAPTSGAVFSTQRSTKARRVTNPSVSEFVR